MLLYIHLQVIFHGKTRNKMYTGQGELQKKLGEKTQWRNAKQGQKERDGALSICWSWLSLRLNFITNAEHLSRKLSNIPLKGRTEECSHTFLHSLSFHFPPPAVLSEGTLSIFIFCFVFSSFLGSYTFCFLALFSTSPSFPATFPAAGLLAFSLYI